MAGNQHGRQPLPRHENLHIDQQFGGGGGTRPQRITDDLDIEHQGEKDASQPLLEDFGTEHDDGKNAPQGITEVSRMENKEEKDIIQGEAQHLGDEHRAEQQSPEGITDKPRTEHSAQETAVPQGKTVPEVSS